VTLFFAALVAILAAASPLQDAMVAEMERADEAFSKLEHPPHYIALTVEDQHSVQVSGMAGTVARSSEEAGRYLDVVLRVGTPELDSTHQLRGFSALEGESRGRVQLALTDGWPLRHSLWQELDQRYRDARERIVVIDANRRVKVEEEAPAADFEPREAVVDTLEVPPLELDTAAWEGVVSTISERLERSPAVHAASVDVGAGRVVRTFVDTEGTRLVHGRVHARVSITAQSTVDDGDIVSVFRAIDVADPADLPGQAELMGWAEEVVDELVARRDAPRGEPYSGPVLLGGQAAGVFFHEVMGHRVEGHRQKREDEGRTFAEQIGKPVLPEWLDVYDDPTIERLVDTDLNGHYAYDNEGVPAARADLVDAGNFVGFLMSRSPIPGFDTSNGHGRRSIGNWPTARMGNTIIDNSRPVPAADLRKGLLRQIRDQELEYGYIVDEIEGGFTTTGRVTPNAFNVRASRVRRVFADGRPDQLVRGIDLVGTPLVAFGNIIAAGDDPAVFNGTCGAESGWVPVSAVAPSLLFSKLEFQLKEKGQERPPLLPKPQLPGDGTTDVGGDL